MGNGPVDGVDPSGLEDWRYEGGYFANKGCQDEWALVGEVRWIRVCPGESTFSGSDCDGATSNGYFYKIRNGVMMISNPSGAPTVSWRGNVAGEVQSLLVPSKLSVVTDSKWKPSDGNGLPGDFRGPSKISGRPGTLPPGPYKWADGMLSDNGKPKFDSRLEIRYLENNPDVKEALDSGCAIRKDWFGSGYEHYIRFGRDEGRSWSLEEAEYLATNPDVKEALRSGKAQKNGWFTSAREHYERYGRSEGIKWPESP